ncbi:AN1-type zinc finger protein 1 [Lepeophtheirus salmonis]|uniref:AN1-type zinc finger protein 1 n=1 Tax=Lepeophtheirus salmonis TaxID=72036 RepID=UPI001AE2900F|nr:AN1-type zinc finger protein 1-like [Lepeophtheirus salmonis]
MAEFTDIGSQCSFPSCRQLDFLPVKCNYCEENFCTEHSFPEKHECPNFSQQEIKEKSHGPVSPLYFKCQFKDCKEKEIAEICCSMCHITTCLTHRHPKDHDCPSNVPGKDPLGDTKEHIKNLNLESEEVKKRKLRTDKAKKTAARVQLMKLKMNAIGAKSIPTDDRIFFKIVLPKKNPLSVYVSKDWSWGKALDSIANLANMPNKNNISTESKKLLLFHFSDGSLVQPFELMSPTVEELLQNNLVNGETLIMDYSSETKVEPQNYAV